jgi:anhydro-N-acetylmuramic acid kinase
MELFIGLMSGTSLDGIDGVLAQFDPPGGSALQVRAHAHRPFPPALKKELLALNGSGADELHRAALAANALARLSSEVVGALLDEATTAARAVRAIGAHGQTVRHRPGAFDGTGYTLQINAPALLAELTGVDVVADFRSRDVAAGGTGAPLVPAFHRAVFGRTDATIGVLNLGGISNLTVLHADGRTVGFDCGPANALMDHWSERHTGQAIDAGGAWAATGRVVEPLLKALLAEPFFALAPPKSTGRDLFNAAWLDSHLTPFTSERAEDIQATLCELTAVSCADALRRHAAEAQQLLVCGGGVQNTRLMQRLAANLPGVRVESTGNHGLPPSQVEASAFAWLARSFCAGRPGNLPSVTGARGPRVLGALYPAGRLNDAPAP